MASETVRQINPIITKFNGYCNTGENSRLAAASSEDDRIKVDIVYYKFESVLEATGGRVADSNKYKISFRRAATEWPKHTGINFEETTSEKGQYYFIIRKADAREEKEKGPKLIADSFFWSDSDAIKTLVMYKAMITKNHYTVFLHELGHVLGFRHEHCFLTDSEKAALNLSESHIGLSLLQSDIDHGSIMHYPNLWEHWNSEDDIKLSEVDIAQSKHYYREFYIRHPARHFDPVPIDGKEES